MRRNLLFYVSVVAVGYSDDQIFEATVCAASEASLKGLRLVLNAMILCSHTTPKISVQSAA